MSDLEAAIEAESKGDYRRAAELAYAASHRLSERANACPKCGRTICGVIVGYEGVRHSCELPARSDAERIELSRHSGGQTP